MLILIYFNPIMGPEVLYSIPEDLDPYLNEDTLYQIKRLMDTAAHGFFTHQFSAELNTANYFFMVPSEWARGRQEMVMITKVIEEENPNLKSYQKEFEEFANNLINNYPEIYKAFYKKKNRYDNEEEIDEQFDILKREFQSLSKFFAITQAQTHGSLLPKTSVRKMKALSLPEQVVEDLHNFVGTKRNYFIVFQNNKDNFKIEIFPYEEDRIIKIAVIFEGQLSPETLRSISMVFNEMNMPFVHTSGICQQGGRCIYEAYLNPREARNYNDTREKLRKISSVDDVKIIEIPVHKT